MKKNLPFLILIFIVTNNSAYSQCKVCGKYIGDSKWRSQELIIKKDSTFEYAFRDIWASLIAGKTTGKWKVIDNEIVLNSKYNNKEYELYTERRDLCKDAPQYLRDSCERLIKIQVFNMEDESIWMFKNVMLNRDTSQLSMIAYEDIKVLSKNFDKSCFFVADSISDISIFNNFYDVLEVRIDDPNINYVKVKGDFSDDTWYTYWVNERWQIRKKTLTNNKQFGNFKKKKRL